MRLIGSLMAVLCLPLMGRATDLPSSKASPLLTPIVAVNWTGFYAGGNVGDAWTESSFTHIEGVAATGESFANSPKGWVGGAQVGGRYQNQNKLVLGAEFGYSFYSGEYYTITNLNNVSRYRISKVGDIWAVSGNIGYSLGEHLVYVKAGYANMDFRYSNNLISDNSLLGRSKSNVGGYVFGTGLEYAITKNFSGVVEYNFYKFKVGNQVQLTSSGALAGAVNVSNKLSTQSVVAKVNYHF